MDGTPENEELFQPQARIDLSFNPRRIDIAEVSAEEGDMCLAADLVERMFADDRVQGVIRDRNNLLRRPKSFLPADDSAKAKQIAEAFEEDFDLLFPRQELDIIHKWGYFFGLEIARLNWHDADGKPRLNDGRNLFKAEFWHPRHNTYYHSERVWKTNVEEGSQIDLDPESGAWWFHMPFGTNRPWSQGCWRAVKKHWLAKHYAINDMARKSEIHGMGTFVYETDQTGSNRKKALRSLNRDLGRSSAIGISKGDMLTILEPKAQASDLFSRIVDQSNNAIAIAIVGQNLSSEVKGGSFGAAKALAEVLLRVIDTDEELISASIFDGPARHYTRINFGDESLTPQVRWDTTPAEDEKEKLEGMKIFAETIATIKESGFEIKNIEDIASNYGFELGRISGDAGDSKKQDDD